MVTGRNLSLGSLVGFVTLFGITLRNSIMLISHYDHLVEVEGATRGLETALRGASERFADFDDRLGDRPWPVASCYWKRRSRTRDRGTDDDGDPRRTNHF